ncbi:MAG: hypothetical protein ACOCVM_05950 [Desulfovibrionaceae bacterium]
MTARIVLKERIDLTILIFSALCLSFLLSPDKAMSDELIGQQKLHDIAVSCDNMCVSDGASGENCVKQCIDRKVYADLSRGPSARILSGKSNDSRCFSVALKYFACLAWSSISQRDCTLERTDYESSCK